MMPTSLGILVVLVTLQSAYSHTGDRVYPIYELTDDMLAQVDLKDGLVDEWMRLVGEPSMTLLDFIETDGDGYDLADLDFRIWLALA